MYGADAVSYTHLDVYKRQEMPLVPEFPRAIGSARSGVLGIECESLGSQLAGFFGVKDGVLVRSVAKDSAAEKAGIRAGDVIVKVDSEAVTSAHEITSLVRAARSKHNLSLIHIYDMVGILQGVVQKEDNTYVRRRCVKALQDMNASVGTF